MKAAQDDFDQTVRQAAIRKNVSDLTIRRAIARGELDARRLGPRILRISASSLNNWGRPLQPGSDAA